MSFLDNLRQIQAGVSGQFVNPNAGLALASVAGAESGGNPTIVNSIGASGLFQYYDPSRLAAFNAAGGIGLSPLQQGNFAANEINSGAFPGVASVLNDPNATVPQMQGVLITQFENPGGSLANPSSPAGGDFVRAGNYSNLLGSPAGGDGTNIAPLSDANGPVLGTGGGQGGFGPGYVYNPSLTSNAVNPTQSIDPSLPNYQAGGSGGLSSGPSTWNNGTYMNYSDPNAVGYAFQGGGNTPTPGIGGDLGAASGAGAFGSQPGSPYGAGMTSPYGAGASASSFPPGSAANPTGGAAPSLGPSDFPQSQSPLSTQPPTDPSNIAGMQNPAISMAPAPGTTNAADYAATLSGLWEQKGVEAVTKAGDTVAQATAKAAETQAKALTDTGTALDTTNTNLVASFFSAGTDWLVRGGIIFFGLIFLAGGVWFFSRQEA